MFEKQKTFNSPLMKIIAFFSWLIVKLSPFELNKEWFGKICCILAKYFFADAFSQFHLLYEFYFKEFQGV